MASEDRPSYICTDCGMSFTRLFVMERHKQNRACHASKVVNRISCPGCSQTFSRTDVMLRHRRSACQVSATVASQPDEQSAVSLPVLSPTLSIENWLDGLIAEKEKGEKKDESPAPVVSAATSTQKMSVSFAEYARRQARRRAEYLADIRKGCKATADLQDMGNVSRTEGSPNLSADCTDPRVPDAVVLPTVPSMPNILFQDTR